MALENADSGGGDWIPEEKLTEMAEGQALAVCRVLRILPGEKPKPTSRSDWFPVVVNMLILSGKYEGSVYRSEKLTRTGFTNTLREKKDPADPKGKAKIPRTEGTDVVVRFGFYTDNEGVRRLCMNAARADDMERVIELFRVTGDDPYSAAEAKDRADSALVMAGVPDFQGSGHVPMGGPAVDFDDDEAPF